MVENKELLKRKLNEVIDQMLGDLKDFGSEDVKEYKESNLEPLELAHMLQEHLHEFRSELAPKYAVILNELEVGLAA